MTSPKRKTGRPATGKTPVRSIRIEDDKWDPFIQAAGTRKAAEVIKALIAWYARLPGAKLPPRPELPPASTDSEPPAHEQQPSSE